LTSIQSKFSLMENRFLLVFGLGYCGTAIALAARAEGFRVVGTRRGLAGAASAEGIEAIPFQAAEAAIAMASHIVVTAPPTEAGDPVLARYHNAIRSAQHLRWIGYLSSTGVYGDRAGGEVDEETPPLPGNPRSLLRREAEQAWEAFAERRAVDIFRLAGIYGPGRSAFDQLRAGSARRVIKPGHVFSRIHRDDIVQAVLAAMRQKPAPGLRIFNLADDCPSESAEVLATAARLLGLPPPPAVPYAEAVRTMSPMARSFWAENRKVLSAKTKATLGITWRYPSYREGLAAILAEERGERAM